MNITNALLFLLVKCEKPLQCRAFDIVTLGFTGIIVTQDIDCGNFLELQLSMFKKNSEYSIVYYGSSVKMLFCIIKFALRLGHKFYQHLPGMVAWLGSISHSYARRPKIDPHIRLNFSWIIFSLFS